MIVPAFVAQSGELARWGRALAAADWDRCSVLPGWTLHDLLGHLVVVHESLLRTLALPADEPASTVGDYVARYSAHAAELEEIAQRRAASADPAALLGTLVTLVAALPDAWADAAEVLASVRGPVTRADFLRTRVLEVVVHADDLARSLPGRGGPALDEDALVIAAGVVLESLAAQRPGTDQTLVVPGCAAVTASGLPGRFALTPLQAVRILTGRVAPEASGATRVDPAWKPVLA